VVSHGDGLRNMRERASGLGGKLQIASAKGKGTRLRITFPVSRDSAIRPVQKGTMGRRDSPRAVRP
jgi:signal transduction histidine kinase